MTEHQTRSTELEATPQAPSSDDRPAAEAQQALAGESEQSRIDELTVDLERLGAEYANYRKRADRDRAAAEQARAQLITALLPALDIVHRAEGHDELTGPLRAVADSLRAALAEAGAEPVGRIGDVFDPALYEAVEHHHSTAVEITEQTVTEVHRPGYRLGGHVLRPALVAVTEPAPELLGTAAADPAETAEIEVAGGEDSDRPGG